MHKCNDISKLEGLMLLRGSSFISNLGSIFIKRFLLSLGAEDQPRVCFLIITLCLSSLLAPTGALYITICHFLLFYSVQCQLSECTLVLDVLVKSAKSSCHYDSPPEIQRRNFLRLSLSPRHTAKTVISNQYYN